MTGTPHPHCVPVTPFVPTGAREQVAASDPVTQAHGGFQAKSVSTCRCPRASASRRAQRVPFNQTPLSTQPGSPPCSPRARTGIGMGTEAGLGRVGSRQLLPPSSLADAPGHALVDAGHEAGDGAPPGRGVVVAVDAHDHHQLQLQGNRRQTRAQEGGTACPGGHSRACPPSTARPPSCSSSAGRSWWRWPSPSAACPASGPPRTGWASGSRCTGTS